MAITDHSPRGVAEAYFAAVGRRDPEGMGALWAPDGVERIHGQVELRGGEAVRAWFAGFFAAFPDLEVRVTDLLAEDERAVVRWRGDGTFTGARFDGIAPTGDRVTFSGLDLLHIRDGRIKSNDAYIDGLGFARRIGLLPAQGSAGERGLTAVFNARTRAARRLAGVPPRRVGDGVWVLRGGFPGRSMNVFAIEDDGGGVTLFDAGIRSMTRAVATFGAARGGINRVVLGHAHADHRGTAPGLGAPVICHPDDRADAERAGDPAYFDLRALGRPARHVYPRLLRAWDGGPAAISGTVEEGEDVSGFRVVHLPGHAPGMIALVRERDGLALTSDAFYVVDPQSGLPCAPRVPHGAFNEDTEQARASLRRLAGIPLREAWPGHAGPVTGDVRGALLAAAGAA